MHVGVHADMHLVTLHAIRMRNEAAVTNRLPFLLPVPDYVRADEVSEVVSDVLIPCILKHAHSQSTTILTINQDCAGCRDVCAGNGSARVSAADAQGGTLTLI